MIADTGRIPKLRADRARKLKWTGSRWSGYLTGHRSQYCRLVMHSARSTAAAGLPAVRSMSATRVRVRSMPARPLHTRCAPAPAPCLLYACPLCACPPYVCPLYAHASAPVSARCSLQACSYVRSISAGSDDGGALRTRGRGQGACQKRPILSFTLMCHSKVDTACDQRMNAAAGRKFAFGSTQH